MIGIHLMQPTIDLMNSVIKSTHALNKFIEFILIYEFTQIEEFMYKINLCIQQIHRIHTHVSIQTNKLTIEYMSSFHI